MRIELSPTDLAPVVEQAVAAAMERLRDQTADSVLTEPEAARFLQVPVHVLRDMRLRGEIPSGKVGREARYSRLVLLDYVAGRSASEKQHLRAAN